MMKKTIGLLAALTLALTAAGASLPASAEEYGYDSFSDTETAYDDTSDYDWDSYGLDDEEREEIEQFAKEHFDPQYGKYLDSVKAAEETAALRESSKDYTAYGSVGSGDYDKYTGYTYTHQDRFKDYDKVIGVDVSYYQSAIDWKKVKADGVDFAIIRLGYRGYGSSGDLVLDTRFKENLTNAKAAGLEVGVYFYTQAITTAEAVQEAEFCLKYLNGTYIDLPVYFDIESVDYDAGRLDTAGLTVAQKTANCKAFCDRMIKGGYEAGIYANPSWLNYNLNASQLEKLYPIWLANYTTYTSYSGKFDTWQYAYTGIVEGIPTTVDMNFDYRKPGETKTPPTVDAPEAPTNLSATLSGSTAVIEWDEVENADKYEVLRYYPSTKKYSKYSTVSGNKATVGVTSNVVPYVVRAVRTYGGTTYYSDYSDIVYVSNKLISNLAAEADASCISLSWDEISDASGYVVYRSTNGGSFTELATVNEAEYTDNKASAGVKYSYKVAPLYGEGNEQAEGALSTAVNAMLAPKKITSLTQAYNNMNSITVRFGHLTNVTGYQFAIYDPATDTYTTKGTVSNSSSSYTFSSLKAGTGYQLCVRAYNTASGMTTYGEWSDPLKAATTIASPSDVKATITPSKVTLSWTGSTGAEGYYVYRRTNSTYVKVASSTSTSVSFTDTATGSRTYAVAAYYPANDKTYTSAYSTPCLINGTIPATPNFNYSAASNGTATLKWSAVPDVTGYRIYMYNSATGTYVSAKTVNAKNTSCKITGITGTTAKFKIKAFRREDNGTVWGNASAIKTVRFSVNAPDYIYFTSVPGSVTAKWNTVAGADSYTVYKQGTYGYYAIGTTSDSSLKFSETSGGGTYVVTANVNSEDGVINSDYSYESILEANPNPPAFISQSASTNSVKLKWNRDYTVDGYRVYIYNKNTGKYEKVKTIQSGSKTTCTVTGLDAGTTYRFKIKSFTRGISGISWSKASGEYTATTASGYSLE